MLKCISAKLFLKLYQLWGKGVWFFFFFSFLIVYKEKFGIGEVESGGSGIQGHAQLLMTWSQPGLHETLS